MTMAGFRSSNHPQQTAKRGAVDEVDDRGTDWEFFDLLSKRFGGFTVDVAAAPHNAKCERYFTTEQDGLVQEWGHLSMTLSPWEQYTAPRQRVWCNPPYSNIRPWVEKAWSEWGSPDGPALIVMLLPANRVEQAWWQDLVEPRRDRAGSPLRVEFLRGRLRFDRPNVEIGPKGDRPPFGCCLLIWEKRHGQDS